MESTQINISSLSLDTNEIYPKLITAYLSNNNVDLFNRAPEISSFIEQICEKTDSFTHRKTLVSALTNQYKFNEIAIPNNISQLSLDNTFTVTTGHQLCYGTGPLYSIYKIATTIKLAEKLTNEYPNYNFIPVFWLASEDHDFEEINHLHLFGKTFSYQTNTNGAVGRISSGDISESLHEIFEIFGDGKNASSLKKILSDAYSGSNSLSKATTKLVHALFPNSPLIIIDGDEIALKTLFIPYFKEEIVKNVSYKSVSDTNKKISSLGYKPQVNPREINLFYLSNNERKRIVKSNNGFSVHDDETTWTQNQLLAEIEAHPENFSPNVLLRPLYQEVVLPNLAYIGGPGESSYWLQLKTMFQSFQVPMPIVLLRSSVMWINKLQLKKIKKLGLSPKDFSQPIDKIIVQYIKIHEDASNNINNEVSTINTQLSLISNKLSKIDLSLGASSSADSHKIMKILENLEKKKQKAEKQKNEITIRQIEKLKEQLYPEGVPQERWDNIISYYLNYGEEFVRTILKNVQPLQNELIILQEEK